RDRSRNRPRHRDPRAGVQPRNRRLDREGHLHPHHTGMSDGRGDHPGCAERGLVRGGGEGGDSATRLGAPLASRHDPGGCVVIKPSDRLIEVLARDERVLDVILSTTPSLKGLRNPVTRRVMGRLATVEQVARMARLEPDLLVRRINAAIAGEGSGVKEPKPDAATDVAEPAPEQAETAEQESEMIDATASPPAHRAGLAPERLFDLDVREDLRNGREPFSRIMAAKAALPEG